jgi:predicted neutral ceramidase superfamily lipid hydrolase
MSHTPRQVGHIIFHKRSDHFYWRLHEWVMTMCLFLTGTAMLLSPQMKNGSILHELERFLTGPQIAWLFFILGATSIMALIANGNSMIIGPRVRSFCAIMRMIIWSQFAVAMLQISSRPPQDWLSPMVIFFGVFSWAEYYVAYRAIMDDVRPTNK